MTTLCAAYRLTQWRQILVIVTAFTIGHSCTLILSSLDLIPTHGALVDILIPMTIMGTALTNIINIEGTDTHRSIRSSYGLALLFGLIHGLAFANNFKLMMFDESIILPLFLFNLGIEVGQLFIVMLFMLGLWLYDRYLNGAHMKWNLFVSGAGFGVASTLLITAATGG